MKVNCKKCGKETFVLSWEEHLCRSCRDAMWDEKIKADIQSGEVTETSCEDKIYCPWCGEVYEGDDDYELMYQDGDHEVTCYHCEKSFKVTTNVSVSYDTERIEEDEDE